MVMAVASLLLLEVGRHACKFLTVCGDPDCSHVWRADGRMDDVFCPELVQMMIRSCSFIPNLQCLRALFRPSGRALWCLPVLCVRVDLLM